jgi:hypothetical protein
MGTSYYQPLTQWSKGDYQGANQLQDDLAIISSKLGYASTSVSNAISNATAVSTPTIAPDRTATSFATGFLTRTGAIAFFKFEAKAAGVMTYNVTGVSS